MPSPPPEMVNILSHLRFGELDEDLTGLSNSNVLTTQAAEMLEAETTSHTERLFLTLLLGMVNQNAILQRQIEGLKDDFEEVMTKHSNLNTTITNRLERIEGRLPAPPPNPAPKQDARNTPQNQNAHAPAKSYLQAAQENLRQWETAPKRGRNKIHALPQTPKGAATFPASQRRFFATRSSPTPVNAAEQVAAELSVEFGRLLARSKQVAPVTALTVSISARGTITVLPPPTVPSTTYTHWFEAMTAVVNNKIGTPENPYSTFRPAPTDVDIAIYSIPLFAVPDKETLDNTFPEAFSLASGITPIATRFLNKDDASRNAKATSTVVVTVSSTDAASIGDSIRLFSKPRRYVPMWSASPTTQCKRCWKFGHALKGCRELFVKCPICTKDHDRRGHRCVIYTCPGFQTPTPSCCAVSPAKSANCGGNHAADSKSCPTYLAIINRNKTTPPLPPAESFTAMDIKPENDASPSNPSTNTVSTPTTPAPLTTQS
ncbi:uncharacterized protein H6S33_005281 [Morchella sextelata]|uniref:uncharacterized protein n=1 Tax=Morchella sextelata TaxID=1174677 RepID=UPI001D053020|nr:uncharacterized protein H6S33_005281 [Morchella sextelata]KAH0605299.1 hypothetical protein H6S33_005281 [Morchella sextelata]